MARAALVSVALLAAATGLHMPAAFAGEPGARAPEEASAHHELTPPAAATPREQSWLRTAGWVALAVGAAGLATAAATAAVAYGKRSSCESTGCPATMADQVNTYNALQAASTAGFWVGSGFTVAGVAWLLLSPSKPESRVGLALSPTFAGVVGRF
jgi:hypothetical protein